MGSGERGASALDGGSGTWGRISSSANILNTGLFKQFMVKNGSFLRFSSAKEEEKQKLLKWSSDLKQEREQLEQKVKQLSSSISVSELPAARQQPELPGHIAAPVAPGRCPPVAY